MLRAELSRDLADNLTDLAIMGRPPVDIDTVNAPFAPHPYVIVAAPQHPLAARRRIPIAALAHEQFLAREKGSDTRTSMALGFAGWLPRLRIAMESRAPKPSSRRSARGWASRSCSAHTVALERQVGSLVVLDVQGFPLVLDWHVVQRKNKRLLPWHRHSGIS